MNKGQVKYFNESEDVTNKRLIFKLSLAGFITYISQNTKVMIGYEPEELIGTHIKNIMHHEDYEKIRDKCQVENDEVYSSILRFFRKDGYVLWVEMTFTNSKQTDSHHSSEIICFINLVQDKRIQYTDLIENEKLKVAGQLAAGVAHEIKNPLTSIKGFIQLMKADTVLNKQYLEIVEGEIQRLESISSELLVLAKPQKYEIELHDLMILVKEVILLLEAEACQKSIQFQLISDNQSFMILCDRHKVKQVLINIVKNGIEAMNRPGSITVRLFKDSNDVQVTITDEGCGIPEEYLEKLGNPFFSTKSKGNGLGLMVCQKIISEHNGHILVESKQNVGTTFKINIPLVIN
jgi:PAS domain S-box-containing protein